MCINFIGNDKDDTAPAMKSCAQAKKENLIEPLRKRLGLVKGVDCFKVVGDHFTLGDHNIGKFSDMVGKGCDFEDPGLHCGTSITSDSARKAIEGGIASETEKDMEKCPAASYDWLATHSMSEEFQLLAGRVTAKSLKNNGIGASVPNCGHWCKSEKLYLSMMYLCQDDKTETGVPSWNACNNDLLKSKDTKRKEVLEEFVETLKLSVQKRNED